MMMMMSIVSLRLCVILRLFFMELFSKTSGLIA